MKNLLLTSVLLICSLTNATEKATTTTPAKVTLKEFVIALKPDRNPEKMVEEKKQLETFLTQELGVPVKVIVPLSAAVILEGFKNGSIDLGYLGSLDMYNAQKQNSAKVLLAGEIKGKTSYESLWLVKKDSPYKSIKDLKGKQIAFASRTSTSGYLVPHKALIEKKLVGPQKSPDDFFGAGHVWYGSGYVTAVQKVLDGTAEAAAVSDYVYLENKHLDEAQKAQLRILEKQGPVPTHVLALRKSISDADSAVIAEALLNLNKTENTALRDQVFTSKIVSVKEDQHLKGIKAALDLTGASMDTK